MSMPKYDDPKFDFPDDYKAYEKPETTVEGCSVIVHHEHRGRITFWWVVCSQHGTLIRPIVSKSKAIRFARRHVTDVTKVQPTRVAE